MTAAISNYLAMGGHGPYVWSAYGITFAVLLVSGWAAARRHRRALRHVQHLATGSTQPIRQPKVTEL